MMDLFVWHSLGTNARKRSSHTGFDGILRRAEIRAFRRIPGTVCRKENHAQQIPVAAAFFLYFLNLFLIISLLFGNDVV